MAALFKKTKWYSVDTTDVSRYIEKVQESGVGEAEFSLDFFGKEELSKAYTLMKRGYKVRIKDNSTGNIYAIVVKDMTILSEEVSKEQVGGNDEGYTMIVSKNAEDISNNKVAFDVCGVKAYERASRTEQYTKIYDKQGNLLVSAIIPEAETLEYDYSICVDDYEIDKYNEETEVTAFDPAYKTAKMFIAYLDSLDENARVEFVRRYNDGRDFGKFLNEVERKFATAKTMDKLAEIAKEIAKAEGVTDKLITIMYYGKADISEFNNTEDTDEVFALKSIIRAVGLTA